MFRSCIITIMAQMGEWVQGSPARHEIFLCLNTLSFALDPPGCRPQAADLRLQVSTLWSPVRKEVLGVGGLCNLAKGVYTEIQAGKTNECKRKTFIHKSHHMFDFKRLREESRSMKSCHFYYSQRKTDGAT